MKLLLIQGANMEYLGRQPDLYGTTSANELDVILRERARELAIEIHMTNIEKRRYGSVASEAGIGMIAAFGVDSYLLALEAMAARLRKTTA